MSEEGVRRKYQDLLESKQFTLEVTKAITDHAIVDDDEALGAFRSLIVDELEECGLLTPDAARKRQGQIYKG